MDPAVFVVLQDCSAFLCSLNENFIQKKLRMRILFKKGKKFLHLQLLQLRCWNPCKFAGRKHCAQHAKLSAKWPEPGSLLVLTPLTTGTESSCISGCFSWFWLVELWLLNTWEQQGFGTCSGQQDCPAAGLALSTKPRCERGVTGSHAPALTRLCNSNYGLLEETTLLTAACKSNRWFLQIPALPMAFITSSSCPLPTAGFCLLVLHSLANRCTCLLQQEIRTIFVFTFKSTTGCV